MSPVRPKRIVLLMYLLPATVLFFTFAIFPVFTAIYYSLHDWSGGATMTFLGLDNYTRLFQDRIFREALVNNLTLAIAAVVFQVGTALVISSLICSKMLKFKKFHRFAMFMPVILAPVVVGFMWRIIYNQDHGLLNFFLTSIGLESWIRPWLDDINIVMTSVTVPIVWQWIGLYVVIFVTAMKNIPEEIFEAAELDGATGLRKALHVTYPMILDTTRIGVILAVSGCMRIFEHVFVLTGGGPGNATMVMAMYAYRTSFITWRIGYGSTISVGILFISLTLVLISNFIAGRMKKRYE